MKLVEKAQIMDESSMGRALTRMAHEIVEKNKGVDNLCFIGIPSRGVPLAARLVEKVTEIEGKTVPLGQIDISPYRDDQDAPVVDHMDTQEKQGEFINQGQIPFNISGKTVILVDDVLFTGRTTRAALDALFHIGRPANIRLAALVDRGHRELPIRPDFIGKNVPTSLKETVSVMVVEIDGVDKVKICEITDA